MIRSHYKKILFVSLFILIGCSFVFRFNISPSHFSVSSENLFPIVDKQKDSYSVKVTSTGSATNIKELIVRTDGKNAYVYVDMSTFLTKRPNGEKKILIKDGENIKHIYLGSDKKLIWSKK